jgi:cytochrome c oxidase assembly protein subunit 15
MGCPDWPRCFGKLVPPTNIEELPSNYQEIYSQKRKKKNARFANMLSFFGWTKMAERIKNDPSILKEAEFNAFKTWTEFLNRLWGALTGLFILITTVFAFRIRKQFPKVFTAAFAGLVLTLFQGWLGSIVVSTNLMPWLVSVHMFIAFIIIVVFIYSFYQSWVPAKNHKQAFELNLKPILIFGIFLFLVQVFFGIEVRDMVDKIAMESGYQGRHRWIDELGSVFYTHRSFSLLVLAINFFVVWRMHQSKEHKEHKYLLATGKFLTAFFLIEIALGAGMAYFGIPAFLQPLHLLFAALIFGAQFLLLLMLSHRPEFELDKAKI